MEVKYHKNFVKNYKSRYQGNDKIKTQFHKRLKLFIENSDNPILKNRTLKGSKRLLKAFSITGDVRVVYMEKDNVAYFLDIGTHNQVY